MVLRTLLAAPRLTQATGIGPAAHTVDAHRAAGRPHAAAAASRGT
eukprot:gene18237-biopygen6901